MVTAGNDGTGKAMMWERAHSKFSMEGRSQFETGRREFALERSIGSSACVFEVLSLSACFIHILYV